MIIQLVAAAVGGLVLLGTGLFIAGSYNELVRLREQVQRDFANVDVLLRQRHDEIPNLVEVCRGHAEFEASTLESLSALRSGYRAAPSAAEGVRIENRFAAGLERLGAAIEEHPELRAHESFVAVQRRLVELEDGIADRRELYNQSATHLNTTIATFPQRLVAGGLGFRESPLLERPVAAADSPAHAVSAGLVRGPA